MKPAYRYRTSFDLFLVRTGTTLCLGLVLAVAGCSPPRGSETPKPDVDPPKEKAPASTAYGKALEAAENLKDKAQEYNDRLEKLNDPFAK